MRFLITGYQAHYALLAGLPGAGNNSLDPLGRAALTNVPTRRHHDHDHAAGGYRPETGCGQRGRAGTSYHSSELKISRAVDRAGGEGDITDDHTIVRPPS
jgi:hypothetical protein